MPRRLRRAKRRGEQLTNAQLHFLVTRGGTAPRITRLRRAVPELDVPAGQLRRLEEAERAYDEWDEEHGLAWRWQLGRPHNGDIEAAHRAVCGCSETRVRQAEEHVKAVLARGRGYAVLGLDREHPDPPGWAEAGRAA